MARAQHTAADGSTVTFDSPGDVAAVATSSIRYQDRQALRELTTAPLPALDALPYTVDEEYAHRGGRLRIGHRRETDPSVQSDRRDTFAVWRGARFGVLLVQTAASADAVIGVLDTLRFDERPTGLALEADSLQPATTKLVKEHPGSAWPRSPRRPRGRRHASPVGGHGRRGWRVLSRRGPAGRPAADPGQRIGVDDAAAGRRRRCGGRRGGPDHRAARHLGGGLMLDFLVPTLATAAAVLLVGAGGVHLTHRTRCARPSTVRTSWPPRLNGRWPWSSGRVSYWSG